MADQTDFEKKYEAAMATVQKLQVALDAALQKHQDDADERQKALDWQAKLHAEAVAQLQGAAEAARQKYLADKEALTDQHAAALQAQADALAKRHAAEIAALKASVLVPALKDLQARQAADLLARHEAEMAKITG